MKNGAKKKGKKKRPTDRLKANGACPSGTDGPTQNVVLPRTNEAKISSSPPPPPLLLRGGEGEEEEANKGLKESQAGGGSSRIPYFWNLSGRPMIRGEIQGKGEFLMKRGQKKVITSYPIPFSILCVVFINLFSPYSP